MMKTPMATLDSEEKNNMKLVLIYHKINSNCYLLSFLSNRQRRTSHSGGNLSFLAGTDLCYFQSKWQMVEAAGRTSCLWLMLIL